MTAQLPNSLGTHDVGDPTGRSRTYGFSGGTNRSAKVCQAENVIKVKRAQFVPSPGACDAGVRAQLLAVHPCGPMVAASDSHSSSAGSQYQFSAPRTEAAMHNLTELHEALARVVVADRELSEVLTEITGIAHRAMPGTEARAFRLRTGRGPRSPPS